MVAPDDWRRMGQERYLRGAELRWAAYEPPRAEWDHDHCEFCGATIAAAGAVPGALAAAYVTTEGARWVCAACFADFGAELGFRLVGPGPGAA